MHHNLGASLNGSPFVSFSSTQVEWLHAFDIHCNAFFPLFLLLYVVQYMLLPILLTVCTYPLFPLSISLILMEALPSLPLNPPPLGKPKIYKNFGGLKLLRCFLGDGGLVQHRMAAQVFRAPQMCPISVFLFHLMVKYTERR